MLDVEEGYGIAMRNGVGIQRRDDVIIEYGKWPSAPPSVLEEEMPERKGSS